MEKIKVESDESLESRCVNVNKEKLQSNGQLAELKPKEEFDFYKDGCFSYADQFESEKEFNNSMNGAGNECLSEIFKYNPNSPNDNQYLKEVEQEIDEQQRRNDALYESKWMLDDQDNSVESCDPVLLEITSGRDKFSDSVASDFSVAQNITTQCKRGGVKTLSDSAARIANCALGLTEQDNVEVTVDLAGLNSPSEKYSLKETAEIYSTAKKRSRKCAFCDFTSADKVDFKNHGIQVHNQFVCSKCRFSTPLEFCLKRHVSLEHSGEKDPNKYKCNFCNFSTSDEDQRSIHMNAFHLKIKQYECPSCDYVIGRPEVLKKHIQYVHLQKKDEKYLKCPTCDYRTSEKSKLKSHVEALHSEVKDRVCKMCGFRTFLKHQLSIHFRTEHSKKETYKCASCNYTGLTKRDLEFHVSVAHLRLKEHKCHLCDFAAIRKRNLITHVRYVHLKQRRYECSLCLYKTNKKNRLQIHNESVHSKLKSFKCDSCGYETSKKIELDSHVRNCKCESEEK